eukprot:gene16317-17960_t
MLFVITKFRSRKICDLFFKKEVKNQIKKLKAINLGFTESSDQRLFINESLTQRNKNLLRLTKIKKRELEFKFVWTRNGNIFIKKNESSPVKKINFISDLDSLEITVVCLGMCASRILLDASLVGLCNYNNTTSKLFIVRSCPSLEQLYQFQRRDKNLYDIIRYLESKELPSNDLKARSILLTIDSYFLNEHSILCHLWTPGGRRVKSLVEQVVILDSLCHEILFSCQDEATAGHLGAIKTYEKIHS